MYTPRARCSRSDHGPLIYWKPVAGTAIVMVAFVTSLALATRPSYSAPQLDASELAEPLPLALAPSAQQQPLLHPHFVIKAFAKEGPNAASDVRPVSKADPLFGNVEVALPLPANVPQAAIAAGNPAGRPKKETFGTAIEFERNLAEAMHVAQQERKLLLILHVSGDFEESEFT